MFSGKLTTKGVSPYVWTAERCIQKRNRMDVANACASPMGSKKNNKGNFSRICI